MTAKTALLFSRNITLVRTGCAKFWSQFILKLIKLKVSFCLFFVILPKHYLSVLELDNFEMFMTHIIIVRQKKKLLASIFYSPNLKCQTKHKLSLECVC